MTGTDRRVGHGVGRRRPLTGAIAANRVESTQASSLTSRDPPEKPVAYTRWGSIQYFPSRIPTSFVRNFTSFAAFAGTGRPPMRDVFGMFQSNPVPSGISACGYATTKSSWLALAFMSVNSSCSSAVLALPCKFKTSGVGVDSCGLGVCTMTVR